MLGNQWRVENTDDAGLPGLKPLLARLLFLRGIRDLEDAKKFLNPSYEDLLDPFLFDQMSGAVARIWHAIETGENIAVYADYDADAVTAAAVVLRALEHLGVNALYYIPDRFKEGYGLNIEAFEKLKMQGANLIITVDCGTNSVDIAKWCLENKIDLIITDHHEVTGKLPDSFSLINPKSPEETYPDKQLTGAGVAFKLVQGVFSHADRVRARRESFGQSYIIGWEKWLLDLASIGTVADCHSLLGENRIVVKYGLQVMAKTRWIGLKVLLNSLELGSLKKLDARSIGFQIAPRINAAGRLEHAKEALDLLLTSNPEQGAELASSLEKVNLRRQGLTERIVSEASEQAYLQQDRDVLVLKGDDWHLGVVGIVAGRMVEKFGKPSIVLGEHEGHLTGSARSREGFNMVECLQYASLHLSKFGGHANAAGLSLEPEKLEAFTYSVLEYAKDMNLIPQKSIELVVDSKIEFDDLNLETCNLLEHLEPCGVGNPPPRFLLERVFVSEARAVGKDQSHLKLKLICGGKSVGAMAFGKASEFFWIKPDVKIDAIVTISADEWNGIRTLGLKILDARPV